MINHDKVHNFNKTLLIVFKIIPLSKLIGILLYLLLKPLEKETKCLKISGKARLLLVVLIKKENQCKFNKGKHSKIF